MGWSIFFTKLYEQIILVGLTTLIAIGVGLPLGIASYKLPRLKPAIFSVINIFQTIPSLALLACLIPILGIGLKPALVAMALYSILPVVINTFAGLEGIPPDQIEAANGLGLTPFQKLKIVELPLAFPVMIAGMRTASVMSVGVATIASFIGAGGLGDFIFQGISSNNLKYVLAGAIPTALLALFIDIAFRKIESTCMASHKFMKTLCISGAVLVSIVSLPLLSNLSPSHHPKITVASKNFTEQFILSEMIAQMLENHTDYHVERKFNLGATDICHYAMIERQIDIYPEYTGTGYLVILHKPLKGMSGEDLFQYVKNQYDEKFNIEWLPPLGFNNSEAMMLLKDRSQKNISEVIPHASKMVLGAPAEFYSRSDGYPGLKDYYGIEFKKILQLEPNLMYEALLNGEVDAIMGFTTSAKLDAYPIKALEDNLCMFPKYEASILVRKSVLQKDPNVQRVLEMLSGAVNEETIRSLNHQVVIENKEIPITVKNFLIKQQLL